jgi:hypothetical protein
MNKKVARPTELCYHNFGATAPILGRGQGFCGVFRLRILNRADFTIVCLPMQAKKT